MLKLLRVNEYKNLLSVLQHTPWQYFIYLDEDWRMWVNKAIPHSKNSLQVKSFPVFVACALSMSLSCNFPAHCRKTSFIERTGHTPVKCIYHLEWSAEHIQGLNDTGKCWILNLGFCHLMLLVEYLRCLWSITGYSVMPLNGELFGWQNAFSHTVWQHTLHLDTNVWFLLSTLNTIFCPGTMDPKHSAVHFNPHHLTSTLNSVVEGSVLLLSFEYKEVV